MAEPEYYEQVVDDLREALATDLREPREWSDGEKLRLLAAMFDRADMDRGKTDREVQTDLRRMADRLDALDT